LGRKPFIYIRRAVYEAGQKNVANLRKAKASKVSVPMADTAPVTPEPVTIAATPEPVTPAVAVASPEPAIAIS